MKAAGNYAPCALVMVPVIPVASMSCNGTIYVQTHMGAYSPFQCDSAVQPNVNYAAMHPLYASPLHGQSAPPHLTESASNQAVGEQPATKKRVYRMVNKKVTRSPVELATATVRLKQDELMLRLALLGWQKPNAKLADGIDEDPLRKTSSIIADFLSERSPIITERTSLASATLTDAALTERTSSIGFMSEVGTTLTERTHPSQNEIASCADSISQNGDASSFAFLGIVPTWHLRRVICGVGRRNRIGVDLGGVIFVNRASRWVRMALHGVRGLVEIFGAENVFIVSRVGINGSVHTACQRELEKQGGFIEKSGILPSNVVFVPRVSGPYGKGAVSEKLGLTHFIDDRLDVLRSIYTDEAGNSGDLVRQFKGKLIHFEHGGLGTCRPAAPDEMPDGFRDHYHPVSGWAEVLECFQVNTMRDRPQPSSSVFTHSDVDVRRIPVGVEDEASLRLVVRYLLKGFVEIEQFAGVKILLRGKGSPHAQPNTEEKNPLSIVVRTKPQSSGTLDLAMPLVEKLLNKARGQFDRSGMCPYAM